MATLRERMGLVYRKSARLLCGPKRRTRQLLENLESRTLLSASFANSDLTGTWTYAALDTKGTITLNGGTVNGQGESPITGGSIINDAGVSHTITGGSFKVDSAGALSVFVTTEVQGLTLNLSGLVSPDRDVLTVVNPAANTSSNMAVLVRAAAGTYANNTLTGTWQLAGDHGRGTIDFNGSGGVTGGSILNEDGSTTTFTGGTYSVSATGGLTVTAEAGLDSFSFTGKINTGKDVIALSASDLAAAKAAGDPELLVLTKPSGVYTNADVATSWTFATPTAAGNVAFNADGSLKSGNLVDVNHGATEWALDPGTAFTIDAAGIVTMTLKVTFDGDPQTTMTLTGAQTASRDVIALNSTVPGDAMLTLFLVSNHAPTFTTFTKIDGPAIALKPFTITYADLADGSGATDPEGDAIGFVIQAVNNGTLTMNGNPVVAGTTVVEAGDSLVWTPSASAIGTVTAFKLRATDGQATSDRDVAVTVTTIRQSVVSVTATRQASETNGSQETDPGRGTFTFTRVNNLADPLDITYTVSGTATEGTDFKVLNKTVSFGAGVASVTVPVLTIDDNISEANETVIATIDSSADYVVDASKPSATVTIADNEPTVAIVATKLAASELTGGTAAGKAIFTLTRSGTTNLNELDVAYAVSGTATEGTDYTLSGPNGGVHTARFAAGQRTVTITVNPTSDDLEEGAESVVITLASSAAYRLSGQSSEAAVTIADAASTVSVTKTRDGSEVGLGTSGTFTITRTNTAQAINVAYTLTGTAGGADYTIPLASASPIHFDAGQASKTVTVTVTPDAVAEGTETVILTLDSGEDYVVSTAKPSATMNITDSSPVVSVIKTKDASEVNAGTTGKGTFLITRSSAAGQLTVNYTFGGTTVAGDYAESGAGSVTFNAGEISKIVTITPAVDNTAEGTETVVLILTPDATYNITPVVARQTATMNIADSSPVVSITKTRNASEVNGATTGKGIFTFTRTGSLADELVVKFTIDGSSTVTDGTDFAALPASVKILAGKASVTLEISPANDLTSEGPETLKLNLTPDATYNVNPAKATATMTVTDNSPVVSVIKIKDASEVNPTTSGVGRFLITRSSGVGPLTVNFTLSGAVSGTDYEALGSTSVAFAAGEVSKIVTITPKLVAGAQEGKTVTLALDTSAAYFINPAKDDATLTIVDSAPIVTVTKTRNASENGTGTDGTFTITRTGPLTSSLTVNYTLTGTAGGADYTVTGGASPIVFAAGQASKTVTVHPALNDAVEGDETVVLTLDQSANYVRNPTKLSAEMTIADKNAAPTLTVINPLAVTHVNTPFSFTFDDVLNSSNAFNAEGTAIGFKIVRVLSGTLTVNGNPVVAGTTTFESGDALVWTPAANASGTISAFTVVAWDGFKFSSVPVAVRIVVA